EIIGLASRNYKIRHQGHAGHEMLRREMAKADLRQQFEIADGDVAVIFARAECKERLNTDGPIVEEAVLVKAARARVVPAARNAIEEIGLSVDMPLWQRLGVGRQQRPRPARRLHRRAPLV